MEAASLTDLVLLGSGLMFAGVVAGLLAGLLGVGGGIVIVPVLYHVFTSLGLPEEVRMHVAVGTSLATIIPTAISSARAHWKKGSVDLALLRAWAPGVVAGVLAGTLYGAQARGEVLTAVFAVIALLVAANMAFRKEGWRLRDHLPTGAARHAVAAFVGGVSAMMGIGGGTLGVPILSACGYPIRRAVGTAALIGLVIAIPGAAGFLIGGLGVAGRPPLSLGYVNLAGFALIVPATVLAAPWGARIAHRIDPVLLKRVFALFLFLTALRMIKALIT